MIVAVGDDAIGSGRQFIRPSGSESARDSSPNCFQFISMLVIALGLRISTTLAIHLSYVSHTLGGWAPLSCSSVSTTLLDEGCTDWLRFDATTESSSGAGRITITFPMEYFGSQVVHSLGALQIITLIVIQVHFVY